MFSKASCKLFFLYLGLKWTRLTLKSATYVFSSMISHSSIFMSRTDKMATWWVVRWVVDKTIKDIPNIHIVLDSRHKKLQKKTSWAIWDSTLNWFETHILKNYLLKINIFQETVQNQFFHYIFWFKQWIFTNKVSMVLYNKTTNNKSVISGNLYI